MIVKPPKRVIGRTVFLAGSIEMGDAEDWQSIAEKRLDAAGWTVFNPRRNDWDSSWKQEMGDNQFTEQVEWELRHLEVADQVILYFSPGTKSPISLLELGLFYRKCLVVCPDGFWRKGNVDIVCNQYGVRRFTCLDSVLCWLENE
jgi:hypothetical protein